MAELTHDAELTPFYGTIYFHNSFSHIIYRMDAWRIVRYPLTTEAAMRKIEDDNTLVFIVDRDASKPQIKAAMKKLYDINIAKINSLNTYVYINM